ncbi:MAG: type VI secretion system protein TssA [Acidobacteriia bacterium]|nr:type VI secretion system protein TssA [Terriglobia bacterium]
MSEAVENRIGAALRAVTEDAPAGRSVRYDPEYEILKAEADKIGGFAAAGVDWTKIAALSGEILEKKSKDLLVMSYFCLALFQTGGYPALAEALGGMHDLLETYWDRLFPEANRLRARVSAIEWLVERCTAAVRQREATAGEADAVGACLEALDALDACLREKLLNEAPSVGDLRGALNERSAGAEPAASAPSPTAPTTAAAVAPVARDLATAEARDEALKDAMGSLKSLAGAIRRGDPRDPLAYRLARVAAWSRVRGAPADTDGRTSVPALGASAETLNRYAGLAARGEWTALLEQAEGQFLQSVLWLDVHRFSVLALRGLGRDYEKAEAAIVHELAEYVGSFPRMLELAFADGTPFASAETRTWIAETTAISGSGTPQAVGGIPPSAGSAEDDTAARAAELARSGKIGEAVALLSGGAERPASARDRFLRRIALARILADAREIRAAVAQMERVEEDLGRFGVEDWEPGLAVEALSVHLRLARALARSEGKSSADVARKAEELYARLARLDARAALAMKA